ncbi:zf-HC2 domain-containing protein [Cellulomonas sp. C5510]|uniref:zf-HC2 domain-containing protein n=1 Tax=Cellulomonas sp. C5510 TaxID=2871170 RepID=UPI001C97AC8F|nr:zf-HC2 domain-containing protein [Cellulomonas sp. C5510]QZN86408.1 zf-HC2 domain-containing protein [Cellulomonas sp. C5510]
MSGHLGDRISALVDGQLGPAATERALVHVAGCPRCAADLAAARAARRVLSDADDVRPAGDLTARLLALGGCPGTGDPRRGPAGHAAPGRMDPFVPPAGAARPSPAATGLVGLLGGGRGVLGGEVLGSGRVVGARTGVTGRVLGREVLGSGGVLGGRGFPGPGQGRRRFRAAVGSLTGLGMVAVGLFLLGDRPDVAPVTASRDALAVLGDAGAPAAVAVAAPSEPAVGATTQEYLDWMRAHGWTCPTEIPDGWAVTSVRERDGGRTLEVDLSGPAGGVVVTEQHGQLDTGVLTAADQLDVAGRTVYVLSTAPWHAAWQSGDTVVEVVAAGTDPEVSAVVARFPGGEFDTGLPARLTRGWDTLTTAVHLP